MSIELVTAFFGWCLVINCVVLSFLTVMLLLTRSWVPALHAKLFNLSEEAVRSDHFSFLANYKLIILALNIAPYIALKLIQ